jgi:hypothetical protein
LVDEAVWLNSGFVEVDEVVGYQFRRMYKLPGGRLAGRLAHSWGKALDWGIGVGIDVGVQWWMDADDPFLTRVQKTRRLIIAGTGSTFSWGIAALLVPGGGWIGVGVGVLASLFWDVWIQPIIYEATGSNPTRCLVPLAP